MPSMDAERRAEAALREQAASFPRLEPAAEAALLARRDLAEAVEKLVEHNLDLVVAQADRHQGNHLSFGDLYQEGSMGLIDAIGVYAGAGGFRDFANLHIGLQMDALIQTEAAARTEEEKVVADVRTLDIAEVLFRKRERRDPSEAEMAALLGWDAERLRDARVQLEGARQRNDALTLAYLEDAEDGELGIDFAPEEDPRRQLPGAGPDE